MLIHPIGITRFVFSFQHLEAFGQLVKFCGVVALTLQHLQSHHVGFQHKVGRRQHIRNQILLLDDLGVQVAIDFDIVEHFVTRCKKQGEA